ncbi:MAG: glycosyltransferase family 4 protein, partial [Bacteroidota bacterium]
SYPDYGFETYSLNAVPHIDIRITISDKTLRDFESFYSKNGLDRYFNRLKRIHNLCEFEPIKDNQIENKFQNSKVLNIAWIGRNSIEKRLNIYNQLAHSFVNSDAPINFNLVTDERATNLLSPNIIHLDRIEDSNRMREFLFEQHLLIITSYREGLPLVYMEAISQGVVVLSTKVGALPDFIEDRVNGFLFDDNNLVETLKERILEICSDIESLIPYAKSSLRVFKKEFSPDQFRKQYFDLLIEK